MATTRTSHAGRRLIPPTLATLMALSTMGAASANEGRPYMRDRTEVAGGSEALGMPNVTIVGEELVLDFRGLEHGEPPTVRATYELDNEAEALTVPLVFASFDIDAGSVTFDGQTIASRSITASDLPDAWASPDGPVASTLGTQPGASGLGFEVEIAPGEHELEVRYTVAGDFGDWNAAGHVVSYEFSPAVSWKALRHLEVTVHCADGWSCTPVPDRQPREDGKAMFVPPLALDFAEVEPGTSRAVASELPKRPLHVLVQRPAPWWIRYRFGALLAAVPFILFFGVRGGARVVLRPRNAGLRFVSWLLVSALIVVLAYLYGAGLSAAHLRTQTVLGGYGGLEYLLLSILGGFGLAIAVGVAAIVAARTERQN